MQSLLTERSSQIIKKSKSQPINNTIYFAPSNEDPISFKSYFKPPKIKKDRYPAKEKKTTLP